MHHTSVLCILKEFLGMRKMPRRWMPHLLTEMQRGFEFKDEAITSRHSLPNCTRHSQRDRPLYPNHQQNWHCFKYYTASTSLATVVHNSSDCMKNYKCFKQVPM
ncbi:hypothetical protein AVEN_229067-1 [Araneus ventricosus]|uniref:Uncharacterized protein n=1 Tax=Araneus ventricosus TaxID=182803 RepID=A0A4Y2CX43_ARAVE|nr:hypothetical protein AVEN_229067-1 [Araneus ventricosus]